MGPLRLAGRLIGLTMACLKHSAIVLIFWVLAGSITIGVLAHGKEIELEISSLIPDASQPLTRLYRAKAMYSDGDLVENANITMVAMREEGGQTVGPIEFQSLGSPGLYIAELDYNRFGNWSVTVTVASPGDGEITFIDAILPETFSESSEADSDAVTSDSAIPERYAVLFEFDVRDTINIIFRFVHALAGAAWFGLIAMILIFHQFMEPQAKYRTLLKVRKPFRVVAIGSLVILAVSGVYNMIYDTPIRSPGVLDLDTMLSIPFGDAYLLAFAVKVIAYPILIVATILIDRTLHQIPALESEHAPAPPEAVQAIAQVGMVVAVTGVLLVIDISILIYMHYISHLSLVIPQA